MTVSYELTGVELKILGLCIRKRPAFHIWKPIIHCRKVYKVWLFQCTFRIKQIKPQFSSTGKQMEGLSFSMFTKDFTIRRRYCRISMDYFLLTPDSTIIWHCRLGNEHRKLQPLHYFQGQRTPAASHLGQCRSLVWYVKGLWSHPVRGHE